ncbi:MAG: hypothetical protein M3R00_02910 [Pseudomonadota bacterium]|nr:hypothetical protein [Pseudomonadota bacterium]
MELQDEDVYSDKSKLQYQSVKAVGFVKYGDYVLTYYRKEHIMLKHATVDESETRGWKFHISINISNVNIVEDVWNLLAPILIKHGIKLAKFIKSEIADPEAEADSPKAGRQVTIFANLNPEFTMNAWKLLFEELIRELKENQIASGVPNKVCKIVEGSENYVMYRNDLIKIEPQPVKTVASPTLQNTNITKSSSPVPRLIFPTDLPKNNEEGEYETYISTQDVSKSKIPAKEKHNPGGYPDIFKWLILGPDLSLEEQFERAYVLEQALPAIDDTRCCC